MARKYSIEYKALLVPEEASALLKLSIPANGVVLPGIALRTVRAPGPVQWDFKQPSLAILVPEGEMLEENVQEIELVLMSHSSIEAPDWFPERASHQGTMRDGQVHVFMKVA